MLSLYQLYLMVTSMLDGQNGLYPGTMLVEIDKLYGKSFNLPKYLWNLSNTEPVIVNSLSCTYVIVSYVMFSVHSHAARFTVVMMFTNRTDDDGG